MSTIIRDAIIRVKLEQQKSSVEGGGEKKWAEGYKAATKAAEEAAKAQKEAGKASEEFQRKTSTANQQTVAAFRESGEGALRMARGIAFLSAQGGADLQKLVQHVMLAQGAFDVFAGGAKMVTQLGAAFGPAGIAVAALTAAAAAGTIAWNHYTGSMEKAREEAKANAEESRLLAEANKRVEESIKGINAATQSRLSAAQIRKADKTRREDEELVSIQDRSVGRGAEQILTRSTAARARELREQQEAAAKKFTGDGAGAALGAFFSGMSPTELAQDRQVRKELTDAAAYNRKVEQANIERELALQRQSVADEQRRQSIIEQRGREADTAAQTQQALFNQAQGGSATLAGGIGGTLSGFALSIPGQQIKSANDAALASIQQDLNKFVEAMRTASTRIVELENELKASATQ
jgi:hypothetical protein